MALSTPLRNEIQGFCRGRKPAIRYKKFDTGTVKWVFHGGKCVWNGLEKENVFCTTKRESLRFTVQIERQAATKVTKNLAEDECNKRWNCEHCKSSDGRYCYLENMNNTCCSSFWEKVKRETTLKICKTMILPLESIGLHLIAFRDSQGWNGKFAKESNENRAGCVDKAKWVKLRSITAIGPCGKTQDVPLESWLNL